MLRANAKRMLRDSGKRELWSRRKDDADSAVLGRTVVSELIIRFLLGGLIVSLFAVLGDLFSPKSFAGLFGAAPSVALATLGLTIAKHGGDYAAVEGRSLLIGAAALFAYSRLTSWLLMRPRWRCLPAALASLAVWFVVALGLWALMIRPLS